MNDTTHTPPMGNITPLLPLNASILQDLKKIPLDDLRLLAVIFMVVAENDITTLRSVSVPENVRPALDNLIWLIKGGAA